MKELEEQTFNISITSLGLCLSPDCLRNFLSNVCIRPCMQKIVKFMEFTFLENALIRGVFTHAPPQSKLAPKFLSSRPIGRRKLLIPKAAFCQKSVSPTSRKGWKKSRFALPKFSQKILR